ncbi:hypothetical protein BO94DRAFT_605321 [Aspergillus sclerotioniger CBS 115572]|uniref:Uncharacterized protein n=1 Tax=Aspergillus sclerotioniger CBS 115572 TaxID=1450535 RepID=A0A317VSZ7_9EURO|nr:hypothetical protein BO94DRAFT_605321 [Aspergillus sclerotioniger CBS 115572]PWY76062.1 hypothetical protein BO94DRAFT_605321 [Aspergillus sclerotioniger CBS 115572]
MLQVLKYFYLFTLAHAVGLVQGWESTFPQNWPLNWTPQPELNLAGQDSCTTSHLTAYETAGSGADIWLSTSPLDDFESPKILPLNSSSGEQWEFDGVSDDGMNAFIFGLYRDPGLSLMGTGNLRISAELAYANGTRWGRVDYASESTVESCPHGTKGVWRGTDFSYIFEISKDMSRVKLEVDTPDLKGIIYMRSKTLPRYADASTWPAENASTAIAPHFHWVEPIPVGDVKVDLFAKGEPFTWHGLGGHNRLWSPFNWFTCLKAMNAVRMTAGPYSLSYMRFTSRIAGGKDFTSVLLMHGAEKIFSTTLGEASDVDDYVLMSKTYDGAVTGTLRDKVTGYELELVSPGRKKHWTFIMEHKNIAFEYLVGKGRGGSGFSSSSSGGPVGLEQFRGVALTEALTFPDSSPLFKNQYV